MKAHLKHLGKLCFEAVADSGHAVLMDGAPELGGADRGARPMEMVLMGLGGCSGIDVMLILAKSRQHASACEIDISAERAAGVPSVFTRIHLHYRISGAALDAKKVARAAALSMEKYCSVTRMLESTVTITHSVETIAAESSAAD